MGTQAHNPFRHAVFLRGAPGMEHLPDDDGREVAFAGRSNVGKSSIINSLAGQRHLVRTSRTPGRTRELNFFEVRPGARLVDLPGYGFARVSRVQRESWGDLMNRYLSERSSLVGVVAVMDIRHPFKEMDLDLLQWLAEAGLPSHIVLNKSDKLSHGGCQEVLRRVRHQGRAGDVPRQLFSSVTGAGIEELRRLVGGWLLQEKKGPGTQGEVGLPGPTSPGWGGRDS